MRRRCSPRWSLPRRVRLVRLPAHHPEPWHHRLHPLLCRSDLARLHDRLVFAVHRTGRAQRAMGLPMAATHKSPTPLSATSARPAPIDAAVPAGTFFERLSCSGSNYGSAAVCDSLGYPNTSYTAAANALPSQLGAMAGVLVRDNYGNYTYAQNAPPIHFSTADRQQGADAHHHRRRRALHLGALERCARRLSPADPEPQRPQSPNSTRPSRPAAMATT